MPKLATSLSVLMTLMTAASAAAQPADAPPDKAPDVRVAAAARDPRIAEAIAAAEETDRALVEDDHAAFAAHLAPDLVVNNPQNGISIRGATGQRDSAGLISYSSYERSIEYAGRLGEFVLLMGEERVVPKGAAPLAGQQVRRRFTDIWKRDGSRWVLAARQATIVAAVP
ncbi:MAG: nuclear transport factor 2 family protein [Pseudoxanthomonas sp.]